MIAMKVLISCTENPNFFIEVLGRINKKVIFDEKKFPSVCRRLPSAVALRDTFF
jgi:hypothetical protein